MSREPGVGGPLQGIRVLDLSRILAGPWASQLLADFGAEVIKVERPGGGDDTRGWGPPWLQAGGRETSESAYFLAANRGKRSVAIDFAAAEGRRLVRQLAAHSDVLLENFKVGTLRRHGLGWEDLRPGHAGLIYCSISAFGQDGPAAAQPGYDAMIQAAGGLMSVTGVPDGEPGAGPVKVGVAIADLMAGMYAAAAILGALHHRQHSGEGQYIDLALFDTQVAWLANQGMNYLLTGLPPQRQGTAHPSIVPYQALPTADGHVMLAVGNDRQFQRLCELLGAPEWAVDARFATNAARVAHRQALIAMLSDRFATQSSGYWLDALRSRGIPCGPINDLAAVFADAQLRHRGMQVELEHAYGPVPAVRNPVRYSLTPLQPQRGAPLLGADTAEVLSELLGIDGARLARLQAAGVIDWPEGATAQNGCPRES